MALTITIRPIDRNPDRGYQETRVALLVGDGTEQICTGAGNVASVTVGVAGTLLTLYDAAAADSLADSNTILIIPTADVTEPSKFHGPPIAFARGLRATTTGGSGKIAVGFVGAATIATKRTYPA